MPRCGTSPSRGGVTLIEVMATIAVIVVVLSFALPSLMESRRRGDETVCLSRLGNIARVVSVYQGGNDDAWPNAFDRHTEYQDWTTGQTRYIPIHNRDQLVLWGVLLDASGIVDIDRDGESLSCPTVWRSYRSPTRLNPQAGSMDSFTYSGALFTDRAAWREGGGVIEPDEWRRTVRLAEVTFAAEKVAFWQFRDVHRTGAVAGLGDANDEMRVNALFADGHGRLIRPWTARRALRAHWGEVYGRETPERLPFSSAPDGYAGSDGLQ
ncbi:MAG: type II secretion system protein [Phycisphaeraceae bacterium]|nr:type II secretion system protein [Phycisphaeraceae bacterium]